MFPNSRHIILIPSQPVFKAACLAETQQIPISVFGLTRPALEASMLIITAPINTKTCVYVPLINTSTEVYRIQNNLLYSIVIL